MKVGLVVITPADIENITVNRKYIVEALDYDHILLRNDIGELKLYSAYKFIEADLYFSMCLFSTLINLFKLGSKAYK